MICGVDPGLKGAFVAFDGKDMKHYPMPVKDGEVDFDGVQILLVEIRPSYVCLERAMPMAMGSKHAFNYGRGFAALEIAIRLAQIPVTYVEPTKWQKVMLEGTSADLKPKVRSRIAVERLFPHLLEKIPRTPKSKQLDEGVIDALLIAGFGYRNLKGGEC